MNVQSAAPRQAGRHTCLVVAASPHILEHVHAAPHALAFEPAPARACRPSSSPAVAGGSPPLLTFDWLALPAVSPLPEHIPEHALGRARVGQRVHVGRIDFCAPGAPVFRRARLRSRTRR